jgi:hypothetical protein
LQDEVPLALVLSPFDMREQEKLVFDGIHSWEFGQTVGRELGRLVEAMSNATSAEPR